MLIIKVHIYKWQAYFCFILVHRISNILLFFLPSLNDWVYDMKLHIINQTNFVIFLSEESFVFFGVVTRKIRENSESRSPKKIFLWWSHFWITLKENNAQLKIVLIFQIKKIESMFWVSLTLSLMCLPWIFNTTGRFDF